MQFEIALFATTSSWKDGIDPEWHTIKVPDLECPPPSSPNVVTTIQKPLRPFSEVRLAWPYREHAVIGSRLYSLGGMNPDSEPHADVSTPEFDRFLKVRSFDFSTPDDGWKPVATMTFPKRFEPPCLVLDDKLYVLGGFASDRYSTEVEAKGHGWMEVYDPDLNTWEPLPNPPPEFGFPLCVPLPVYFAALDSKKQILVAQNEGARYKATFYVYHVIDRCWTILEPRGRELRPHYPDPVFGKRSVVVDNTIYWGFVLDGYVFVQSFNIDTDLYFHGSLDTQLFLRDSEFEYPSCPILPLLHLADQTFCLFLFTLVDKMEYTGMVYLNCIVLDISLNPFKDEGKQQSKVEFDECYKYNFMGDSSKQLNISLVSVQRYPLRNIFWLHDALLLDRPTYMPMKKKPKLSHETSVMIKDN
ncbi:uncharacterized protein LOC115968588 [Quercus lobata]|uniref:Galactose oxidase/kelch repeat superfamily protein n=1 Tax=Quercus lobata TaxID=97700 RepID=A0A7N2MYQ1_QUELO|nr:uncharacterized protein LOC115968588 [Quercus lobata]XP_030943872.1 uncharacterized protein LOC115968588 [Quercus lobata]